MNISKFKIVMSFLFGGGATGVIDYVLDVGNTIADRLPDAKREEVGRYLATARRVLDTMGAVSWLCPRKWLDAYEGTVAAFGALVAALNDLKVTRVEIEHVSNAFKLAYASWRAE